MEYNPLIQRYATARERLRQQEQLPGPFTLLWNPAAQLVLESGADRRRENLPTAEEVGVLIPDNWNEKSCRDIVLAVRGIDGQMSLRMSVISPTNALYMPSHYILLFPMGEYGWHYGLLLPGEGEKHLEQRMFYRRILRSRVGPGGFSLLVRAGRLFQQYLCNAFVACDDTKIDFFHKNQDTIRSALYSGLSDALVRQDITMAEIGTRFVLPSNHIGSSRSMHQLYQDSMAICRLRTTRSILGSLAQWVTQLGE